MISEPLELVWNELEKLADSGRSLKTGSAASEFREFGKQASKVQFMISEGWAASAGGRKLKELSQLLSEIAQRAEAVSRQSSAEELFRLELKDSQRIGKAQGAAALGRQLTKDLKRQKKDLLELLGRDLTKMDLKNYQRSLQKIPSEKQLDADRSRNLLRKKYLKSLLPLQLFNAEGQQSRSAATFASLKRSLSEIIYTAERFSRGEEDDLVQLRKLGDVLSRILVLDCVISTVQQLLSQERDAFNAHLEQSFQADRRDWSAIRDTLPRFHPGKWLSALQIIEDLRQEDVQRFLLIWDEIEYQKIWFQLFNQTFS